MKVPKIVRRTNCAQRCDNYLFCYESRKPTPCILYVDIFFSAHTYSRFCAVLEEANETTEDKR